MKLTTILAVLFLACAASLPDVGTPPPVGARVVRVDVPNADVVVFDDPAVVWITER